MKKLLLLICKFLCLFRLFALENSLNDLEKIRWVDCGENLMEFSKIETIKFRFYTLPTINAYKIYQIKNRTLRGGGEYYDFEKGYYNIEVEIRDGYFTDGYDKSYTYEEIIDFINKKFIRTNKFLVYKGFTRADKKKIDAKNLEGVYVENNTGLKTYIVKINNSNFLGYVLLSDNNGIIDQWGYHYITFKDDAFYSDKSFKNNGNYPKIDDAFSIKIEKNTDTDKLLLLDTPKYTRPYVPMEDFFTSKTDHVFISGFDSSLLVKNEYPALYSFPDFNSEIIYKFSKNEIQSAKILERKEKWQEYHERMSIWIKVHLNTSGSEGWIWGGYVDLGDYTSGLDTEKVLRYEKYNIIKKIIF